MWRWAHWSTHHIFVPSKAPWYDITDDLPQYRGHKELLFPIGQRLQLFAGGRPEPPSGRTGPLERSHYSGGANSVSLGDKAISDGRC
jgi:hypothetical protein